MSKIIYNATGKLKKNQLQYNIIFVIYNGVKCSNLSSKIYVA